MTRPGTTSIATRYLVALLDAAGEPPEDLLAQAGVARTQLDSPDLVFPLEGFRELWARAAARQPDIGLAMIERFPPGQMHMLAHLAMRAPNVGTALDDACRHARVTSAADVLQMERLGERVRLAYSASPPNPWMAEHYLSLVLVLLARATGRDLPVRRVEFVATSGTAPDAAYLRRFGVAPVFGAARNALEFDAGALDWPLQTQDGYLHAILERVAEAREPPAEPDSVLEQARREIARHLLQGATPSTDDVARAIGLSARALRARLAAEGSGFRALLDGVRRDLAREHLGRGLSVTETAYLLGFSEPAAFQHACRRWFGEAAGELRKKGV
jgi:AraC-like DNA-binding protein